MMGTLLIPRRFCGPARSGNGGYVAGSLAHELGDTTGEAVTVVLRQPPPLDVSMHVSAVDERLDLTFGGALVAHAAYDDVEVEPVEAVSHEHATEASTAFPGFTRHPFPACFVCGTERADGLRIFPGPVSRPQAPERVAAPWTPPRSEAADWHEYDESARRACLASTWAALDCIGGWAGGVGDRLMVLGQMTAVVDALPVIGDPHVLTAERRAQEGRRTWTASTLHDPDGRIVARAQHVWVAVDPAPFEEPTEGPAQDQSGSSARL